MIVHNDVSNIIVSRKAILIAENSEKFGRSGLSDVV